MNVEKRKKVEILIPEDLSPETAQSCFLVGLKTYLVANSAGLCVTQGVETDEGISLKLLSFKGEFAAAISKFCEGTFFLQEQENQINDSLLWMRSKGSEILKEYKMDKKEEKLKELIEELGFKNSNLLREIAELKDLCFFLEAEVLALGNLLIRSGQVKQEDLVRFTDIVLRQKAAEREKEKSDLMLSLTEGEIAILKGEKR